MNYEELYLTITNLLYETMYDGYDTEEVELLVEKDLEEHIGKSETDRLIIKNIVRTCRCLAIKVEEEDVDFIEGLSLVKEVVYEVVDEILGHDNWYKIQREVREIFDEQR